MIYSKTTIKNISESVGIPKLKDGITTAMAQDVEYRLHEIISEAMKFMKHSKRTKLSVGDINSALRVRNVEPIYGFETGRPVKFHKATTGLEDIYYVDDEQIDLDTLLDEPLPSVPLDTVYTAHWLAIEGVQPRIQQNPIPSDEVDGGEAGRRAVKVQRQDGVETIPLVKHVLSKELQLYYECITESLQSADPVVKATALESISVDAGIHQLVTYFVQYVAVTVKNNLHNLE
ncbi:histone H4-like TAF Taf6, SAGA complex subunit, partial [Coemansia sp. RSA 2702]